jgi:phosphoribosyl 1,2-cyclic phosphodiesterase
VKISVLGSSSSGNCTFVATSQTKILLDAGLNPTQTLKRLSAIGESLDDIDALIISHEHADHVCGIPGLLGKRTLPVYIGNETFAAINPNIECDSLEFISAGEPFQLKDLKISPFSIPHDAVDPVGFTLEAEGIKIAHVTDLGYLTELVVQKLRGCDVIVLESNHDLEMLKVGPYPWFLKQRIRGRSGHLSNAESSRLLAEVVHAGLEHVILAHLSEINNTPERAATEASQVLAGSGTRLTIAAQSRCSPLLCLE